MVGFHYSLYLFVYVKIKIQLKILKQVFYKGLEKCYFFAILFNSGYAYVCFDCRVFLFFFSLIMTLYFFLLPALDFMFYLCFIDFYEHTGKIVAITQFNFTLFLLPLRKDF